VVAGNCVCGDLRSRSSLSGFRLSKSIVLTVFLDVGWVEGQSIAAVVATVVAAIVTTVVASIVTTVVAAIVATLTTLTSSVSTELGVGDTCHQDHRYESREPHVERLK
jgi:hypothetical protein